MSMGASGAKLDAIFCPKSVAVVGASTRPGTVGNDIFRNLLLSGFDGSVYPVNPKSPHVLGVHAYKSLSEIPGGVDMAVMIVPSKAVIPTTEEAISLGVKGLVVISAGFKEVGAEGAKLELQLAEIVRKAGVPLVGPNCLGVINTDPKIKMNAAFGRKMPSHGNLAFVSQSGALCCSVLDYAEERHMGFSKFISFGNKADVNEIDLLAYLANDPQTSVIAMYLEDITNGRQFIETARDIFWETRKPMLCLKSGRSPEGAKAASSHTGSLAGSDSVYDALLAQSGVQRVDTIAELFDYAALYTTQPLPKGKRIAIITNAGGPGIMATDAAVKSGLKLAEITEETRNKLKGALPDSASLRNPIDVIGDARSDRYKTAAHEVLNDPGVDMGLVILTPQSVTEGRGNRLGPARHPEGHRQAGGLLVHGRSRCRPGRGHPPSGRRSQLRIPRGRREEPRVRRPPGRQHGHPAPRDADVHRPEGGEGQGTGHQVPRRPQGALPDPGRVPPDPRMLRTAPAQERHGPVGCRGGHHRQGHRQAGGHEGHVRRRGPQVRRRRRHPQRQRP